MPALILGAGYLGAALANRLCAAGERAVALDSGFATDWPALEALAALHQPNLQLITGDIRDVRALEGAFRAAAPISAVYLLAAQASAHESAAPPEYTEETNLRGPRLVLDVARRHGAPPVVYGSSFHVYGQPLRGEVDESRPYGAFRDLSHLSKLYAEKLGELYAREHAVPFAPVRLGIVYGVGPVTKRDLRFVTVPHAFCLRALRGETLRVTASGLAPLGFIHLEDAASALTAAVPTGGYAPANAVGELASAVDVARAVKRAARELGREVSIEVPDGDPSAGEPAYTVTTRLSSTGWQPRRRLAESTGEILAHYAATEGRPEGVQ